MASAVGCSKEDEQRATDAAETAVEKAEEAAGDAADAVKEGAADAAKATQEAAGDAAEMAETATDEASSAAAKFGDAASLTAENALGDSVAACRTIRRSSRRFSRPPPPGPARSDAWLAVRAVAGREKWSATARACVPVPVRTGEPAVRWRIGDRADGIRDGAAASVSRTTDGRKDAAWPTRRHRRPPSSSTT
jgi:hypothetical protein